MPVHEVVLGKEGVASRAVEVWLDSSTEKRIDIEFSELQGTRAGNEATIIELVQLGFDTRQRVNTLPNDDPDKVSDPGRDNLYWGRADGTPDPTAPGGQLYLIGRGVVCTAAPWDATEERYLIELRRSHNGPIGS